MNSVLKLILDGEALDTAQIGKILGLGAEAPATQRLGVPRGSRQDLLRGFAHAASGPSSSWHSGPKRR